MDNSIFIAPIVLLGFVNQYPSNDAFGIETRGLTLPIPAATSQKSLFNGEAIDVLKYTIPIDSSYHSKINRRLTFLSFLKQDWNGDGADVPTQQTFFNARRFVERFPDHVLGNLKEEDVSLTPYGTIVFDFQNKSGDLVSVEIGKEKIGFFTDFISGNNVASLGEKIGVNGIPKAIMPVFERFLL